MAFTDSEAHKLAEFAKAEPERWHAGWHLKKEIQLAHVISTVLIMVSALWYVSKLEQRIALVEGQVASHRERVIEQERSIREAVNYLRSDMAALNNKLDRLIERERGGK